MGHAVVTPRLVRARRNYQRALELRAGQSDWESIASDLGYRNVVGLRRNVVKYLDRTDARLSLKLRRQMDSEITIAMEALLPLVNASNLRAIERYIGLIERRAKLWKVD